MKILIGCEYSGVVRQAFEQKGHDVLSCDFLETELPGNHYQGDIEDLLHEFYDIIISFNPCTNRCNSGVRWLIGNYDRNLSLVADDILFNSILDYPYCGKICIENPIPHKYSSVPKYTQIINPWQFGHGESKSTCLWLRGLPKLIPENIVSGRYQRIHLMPPGVNRSKERSRTYQGVANAMANQWG